MRLKLKLLRPRRRCRRCDDGRPRRRRRTGLLLVPVLSVAAAVLPLPRDPRRLRRAHLHLEDRQPHCPLHDGEQVRTHQFSETGSIRSTFIIRRAPKARVRGSGVWGVAIPVGALPTPPRGLDHGRCKLLGWVQGMSLHIWSEKNCRSEPGPGRGTTGAFSRPWRCPIDLKFCL